MIRKMKVKMKYEILFAKAFFMEFPLRLKCKPFYRGSKDEVKEFISKLRWHRARISINLNG